MSAFPSDPSATSAAFKNRCQKTLDAAKQGLTYSPGKNFEFVSQFIMHRQDKGTDPSRGYAICALHYAAKDYAQTKRTMVQEATDSVSSWRLDANLDSESRLSLTRSSPLFLMACRPQVLKKLGLKLIEQHTEIKQGYGEVLATFGLNKLLNQDPQI